MRRQDRGTRVVRGAAAAGLATFVALLSHVRAGGEIPGPFGIVVPLALSFVVCVALAGRRLSLWRLAPAVGISQILFHALFVLGTYDRGVIGHVHGAPVVLEGTAGPLVSMDATMGGAHLVAAALTTLALHRAESTVAALRMLADRLLVWLRARASVIATGPAPLPRRSMRPAIIAPARPVSLVLASSARRRGPPVFVL